MGRYVDKKWLPWMEEHNSWEEVHGLYAKLFAIHQEQRRLGEEYELVLGLGLLTWQTPDHQRVRRHLVVADAILEFEAGLRKFTVGPHTEGAKLRHELDMLNITEQPERAGETAEKSLTAAEDDPWEIDSVANTLQELVHSISPEGAYNGSLEANDNIRASAKPIVELAPALILRKRSVKGLIETLNVIKEQLATGGTIPSEWLDLAESQPRDDREPAESEQEPTTEFGGEIFFPKPANEEQRRIVKKMRLSSGVLVQGPPGTGKSHTIANLICHLLATGKRTLITAKTSRALQVLADRENGLLPKELQPLCINLLGSGLDERQSLEASVGGILQKNEEWNEEGAQKQRVEFEGSLRRLREEKTKVDRRLHDIRESETHTRSVADGVYQGTAARIAESVNRNRATFAWFTDSIAQDKTCPSHVKDDLPKVLTLLRTLTADRRQELSLAWPEVLPPSEDFATRVREEADAIQEEQNLAPGADEKIADLLTNNSPEAVEAIHSAYSNFLATYREVEVLGFQDQWMRDAKRDILSGKSPEWQKVLDVTHDITVSIERFTATADSTDLDLPDNTNIRSLREHARELQKHMENGGKLGWGIFRPQVVKERWHDIKTVRINGRFCSTSEHFSRLADTLQVRIECERAWGFWKGRSDKPDADVPYTLQLESLKSQRNALEKMLTLGELIANCREKLRQCPGLKEPAWDDEAQLERFLSSCRLALAYIRERAAAKALQDAHDSVTQVAAHGNTHPVINDFLAAIRERDTNRFARCADTVHNLKTWRQDLQQVDEYLAKLRGVLPNLVESLEQSCGEPYWDERVQRIGDAWHWGQARYWLEEYIRQEDAPALVTRAKQIEDQINDIIAKLAASHAWSFCFSRLMEDHRRHMEAWRQEMRRLGKGTGKYAGRHRREAQKHLNGCREAVPAWIMPLRRLWDTVRPAPAMFDVIIVDEASQCDFEAFPLFYLGKKILIVGDDRQISPEAVGHSREPVQRLQQDLLYDFEFKSSFDPESSLFDHGKLRHGQQRITLREHFRCMPEIIRFSNDLCYSATPLIPLRQYGPDRLPPLDHKFVPGGYRQGDGSRVINRPEAEDIVEKIAQLCDDSRYDEKTMGVVVLQGEAQATLIENMLLQRIGPEQIERRRLVCGNPYSFQGDQRDIMFLSLVAAGNEKIRTLTTDYDKRRFNVAASRARDSMILFHSVERHDLRPSCLRRRLIEFFENTKPQQIAGIERNELERLAFEANRLIEHPPDPFGSWFEVDVALELLRKGFTVLAQYEVASKLIDLVVEGGLARLAIECDGDHWHGADRYEEDMQRQRQLERCGWEFFRVRESAFYADKEKALARMWTMLEARDIFPNARPAIDLPGEEPTVPDYIDCDVPTTSDDHNERNVSTNDVTTDDEEEESDPPDAPESEPPESGHRLDAITSEEIQNTILLALSKCPNYSCTLHSLTARVLHEIGVVTRGKPREAFEKRTKRCVVILERAGRIQQYRTEKNQRLKLI